MGEFIHLGKLQNLEEITEVEQILIDLQIL